MRNAVQKATDRAVVYRRAVAELRAAGRDRDALAEALRWLRAEAVHAEKLRPQAAPELYGRLEGQVSGLAEFIADPPAGLAAQPVGLGPRQERRAARHRQARAQLRAAGQHRQALAGAVLWLASAAAASARADPAGSARMYGQLTDRITGLAAEVPGYRPAGRRH
ncbi:MAG TPA: hypothetical protein VGM53_34580 [Streptosporangiaceae bacterium]